MHKAAVPAAALLGVGINSVDVDDVSGPLVDGGTFDITTDDYFVRGTALVVLYRF